MRSKPLPGRRSDVTAAEFGAQLKELGWSKSGLADRLGIHRNTVSRWITVPRWAVAYVDLALKVKRLAQAVAE